MKKLKLNLGGVKEMLSREQMKKVTGGYDGTCTNACVGPDCPSGGTCQSRPCPNDPNFTHIVCVMP